MRKMRSNEMANPKKESSKPKEAAGKKAVFDVAPPGSNQLTTSTTSKPVLVSNRPVMNDPMVVADGAPTEAPEETPVLTPVRKKVIMPLNSDVKPDAANADSTNSTPALEAETGELPNKPDLPDLEAPAAEAEKDEEPVVKTETGEKVTVLEPETKAGVPETKREEKELSADQAIAAEKAAQEREAKLQTLIDEEQYFLPINATQARRNRNFAIVGLVVIVVLALAWYNIALDAGLLPNQFNLPHTSFFTIE